MPERIVDLLEAVQIQHQQRRPAGVRVAAVHLVHPFEESTAVGEPGQFIGPGLQLGLRELADLGEGHPGSHERDQNRGGGERNGHHRQFHHRTEHQQADGGNREESRDGQHTPAGEPLRHLPLWPLESGVCRQHQRQYPENLDRATRGVPTGRDLTNDNRVSDGENDERATEQAPDPLHPPAQQPEHADHDHQQHQVGKRVGEVQPDGRQTGRAYLPDGGGGKPAGQCGHAESTDQSVKPDTGMEP